VLADLAEGMKDLRPEKSFSQEAFANHAGLHRVAVGWIEQGKGVRPHQCCPRVSHNGART
jgi:hypothetical protein